MANYTKVFTKPYADGYEDLPSQNTPITAETLNDKDDTLEHIEDYLYDNPIAEVVDNLTTNDASKALSAKQGKILNDTKLNVNDLPNSEVQTSDDGQFTTVTGGLMQKCIVDLEPIQSGSGTPTPSNVRTISGHTQVQVGNCGKNVFDEVYPNIESYTSATVAYKAIAVSNGTYTMSTNAPKNISENANLFLLEGNVQTGASTANNGVSVGISRTVESVNGYITVGYRMTDGVDPRNYNVQIEKGSQATEYTPYNGYTTTINLGGTYYGGTLDAVSGKLTVTYARVDLGSYTWNKTGANLFFTEYPRDFKKAVYANGYWYANGDCECYKFIQDLITSEDGVINLYFEEARSYYRIFVNDSSRYSLSASDFKTAVTGQYLVYELATPQTIQLTPKQLETLVGQNDVFAPLVGQTVEEVEFREVLAFEDVNPFKTVEFTDANNLINAVKVGKTVTVNIACDSFAMVGRMSEDAWDYITSEALPEEMRPQKTIHANILNILTLGGNYNITSIPCRINTTGIIEAFVLHQQTAQPYGTITYVIK